MFKHLVCYRTMSNEFFKVQTLSRFTMKKKIVAKTIFSVLINRVIVSI